ncbi:MAG: tRNA lysidine(34) synthetase TilS [Parvibaculum sp.]|uniref:tRNA lysidine(34) synthetase TilS n=1 Tax=Parvibaculum sp. TaxID=2024848 RepID=UPI0027173E2D|nr:tRNA lysidine(34) synthetase TilS [Parvibaculum sp.]MDO8839404.1 tRNA lysidine(34) synthetase TilS [Parvibaculum sp.]
MRVQEDLASSGHLPIQLGEFAERLLPHNPSNTIAVAFSGGPDSLALLILAARWVRSHPWVRLFALTVDHGLRAGSAVDAETAGRLASTLGIPHDIVHWGGDKPESGIQAAAREARYRLLAAACRERGCGDLLVAHHLEDQAETFLLRLRRGSGVDGLSAMPSARVLDAGDPPVRLLRPLLDLPRGRLAATVAQSGLEPILDPSNENDRFDRVKIRQAMHVLEALGFDAAGLAGTARRMARAREVLETQVQALLATHAVLFPFGYVEADAAGLAAAPSETRLRALAAILKAVSGRAYGPRMEGLAAIEAALLDRTLGRGRTLNGVKFALTRGRLLAVREMAAVRKTPTLRLAPGEGGTWDNRFKVGLEAGGGHPYLDVRALGIEGLSALDAAGWVPPLAPKAVLMALPALWAGESLVSAPHLGTLAAEVKARASLASCEFFAQV